MEILPTARAMPSRTKPHARLTILALALLVLLAGFGMAWLRFTANPPVADDRHYVAMAWNLAAHGVPSLAPPRPDVAPPPTMFREPGYPLLLSGLMRLVPAAGEAAFCTAGDNPAAACRTALRLGHVLNVLLILAAASCTALAVWWLCGSAAAALLALAVIALSPKVMDYADFLISESLALFLAAAAATLLLPAALPRRPALAAALAAGLACGALAATKQAFLPLVLPAAAGLALAASWPRDVADGAGPAGRFGHRLLTAGLPRGALLVLGWGVVVGGWLFWNLATFGSLLPSDRAREGEVLAYRVELLDMRPAEYGMAWLWWTSNFGDNWARDGFPEADWQRFQDHRAEGFTPSAHRRWAADVAARQAEGLDPGAAYDAVARDYQGRLLERWPRHLLISLPVLNRGLWVDSLALLTVPCLLAVLALAWRWGVGRFYLFALPGLTGLAVHTGLTNNIPRWNLPLAPVLAAATALVAWRLLRWLRPRLRRSPPAGAAT